MRGISRQRLAFAAAASVAALVAMSPVEAAAEVASSPRQTVEAANARIKSLLEDRAPEGSAGAKSRDAELKRVVTELLDLDQMAEDAMGREWSKRSSTERAEYVRLLKQLVERSYLRQARSHVDYTVEFGEASEARRGRVEVPTTVRVRRRGRQEAVEVVYTLFQRDGRWRVVDIETDGVSTVRNYRSQFRRIIDQDGFAALLDRMRTRLAEGEVDL